VFLRRGGYLNFRKIGTPGCIEIMAELEDCDEEEAMQQWSNLQAANSSLVHTEISDSQNWIVLEGARENNLKNVSLRIPKDKFVVFTGVSGSGKSSLVFDTIYAEAHRQLLGTWSAFSRTRLPKVDRPDFDSLTGIAPAIVIDQKVSSFEKSSFGVVDPCLCRDWVQILDPLLEL
jgi:ABC-type glutathione transport system ATPase component